MAGILECILLKPLNTLWTLYKQRELLSYSLTSSQVQRHTHSEDSDLGKWKMLLHGSLLKKTKHEIFREGTLSTSDSELKVQANSSQAKHLSLTLKSAGTAADSMYDK